MALDDRDYQEYVTNCTNPPPRVLYKYTTAETAKIILSTGKLRHQTPLRYNDPFDAQWDVFWQLRSVETLKHEQQTLEKVIRDARSWPRDANPRFTKAINRERARIYALPSDEREAAITKFLSDAASSPTLDPRLLEHIQDYRRRLRVLCLCEDDASVPMWSHYADQHQGVVLAFDSKLFQDGIRRPIRPIEYQDDLPELVDANGWVDSVIAGKNPIIDAETLATKSVLTKHTNWAYEREWRIVTIAPPETTGEHEDIEFEPDSLLELTAGCRVDSDAIEELRVLAKALTPTIQSFRMEKHHSKFALNKQHT